jgi:hypothetical protein
MSLFVRLRAAALSAVLAVSPALPVIAETAPAAPAELSAEALMARLDARPAQSTSNLDVESLNAALAGKLRLSYDFATQESLNAPTRLTGLKVELLGEDPMTLFTADELLVWNADTPALLARLSGERLGETVRLFDRLELSGVKLDLTDYTNAVDDAVTAALPETPGAASPDITYEDTSVSMGRMIFNGLSLHPWTHAEVEGQEEGLAAIRLLSAFARSFSLESSAITDLVMSQSMSDGSATGTMVSTYPAQFMEGYDRGDIALTVQSDTTFAGSVPVPATDASADGSLAPALTTISMAGKVDYGAWTDLKFSKLLEYGERGELPPITERDLWSFGTYTLDGMTFDFGGRPIMEIGRLDISADKFAWFLPERILVKHEDVSFDFSGIMQWAADIDPELAATAEDEPSVLEMIGIMDRTGLGKLSGDGTFLLSWDSETGSALIEANSVSDGLYADNMRVDMRLPAYADLIPAFGVDGRTPDNELLRDLFTEKFSFSGGHYSLTDTGLLDAIAKLTIEIAKISGDSDPMLSNFAESTPESVRMFASGMLMFGGGAVSQEIPQATGWINGLSSFITSGGTFTVKLAPERALTAADFAPDPEAGMVEAPGAGELVDLFGVSMTHTAPAPTAAGTP